jgi:hypothetical protein
MESPRSPQEVLCKQDEEDTRDTPDDGEQALVEHALLEAACDDRQGYISYGFDGNGVGVHNVIGNRCNPYTPNLMMSEDVNISCHSNLVRAAVGDGLEESDVHDVLNVFMCTGFNHDTNQYFAKPSLVEVGDYIEFLVDIDLLVSTSTCPQGDVRITCGNRGGVPVSYPLTVEIKKPREGWLEWRGRSSSEVSGYCGDHGLRGIVVVVDADADAMRMPMRIRFLRPERFRNVAISLSPPWRRR